MLHFLWFSESLHLNLSIALSEASTKECHELNLYLLHGHNFVDIRVTTADFEENQMYSTGNGATRIGVCQLGLMQ